MKQSNIFDLKKPSAFSLAAFESVDSTNDELRRRAVAGCLPNTVVCALEQTKGRGRRGRTWVSEPGNLFCSILQKPNVILAEASKASFVSALAIYDAISEAVEGFDCDVTCKWPNDVLVDGYKVSGILLESQVIPQSNELDWLIVGIGINLAHAPAETPYPCGYINAYREKAITPPEMLEILLKHFQLWFERWESLGFTAIRNAWLDRAKGVGEEITVNLSDEQLRGTFETLDAEGALVLRTKDGQRLITAGDVFFD
ncbi:Biotin--(acetyl-CoA-carboxylase) ligase [Candidatus Terasakiella magnetica]|uniref:biotin--[biotin carboxyl-carrier protein] ligase n=1 Tax=Candidatus Terasakiella magnetica TaxID=1867952 RepID=A0A1C3RCQ7_9PROT|nr:biotin--[acetyl-CoA-carboxylase] ligase [Candidatus Terasakiella magnetica]SCA55002.1 Biotin--(acetyl-CoA-carboxylase) ligase [Candidatus Terasakiella magnetica]